MKTNLLLLFSLVIIDCNAQLPVAGFFATDTTVCPGKCINFTNTSANAVSYQWSFPGGSPSSSTDENPAFICYSFPEDTVLGVTLIATDSLGRSETLTISNYITVYPDFVPPPLYAHGDTLLTVQGYASYQWYFGSDTIPGATNYYYLPHVSGNYNLVVTDSNECSYGLMFGGISVIPAALFYASNDTICAGACIRFYNQSQAATSYQWFFPGAITDTSTSLSPQNICYNTSGIYTATLIASNISGSDTLTFPNYIHVSSCVSVPEYLSSSLQLYLSPNPVSDILYLHLLSKEKTIATVQIKNLLGQEISVHQSEFRNPNSKIEINCGEFPAGIYFVRVMTEDDIAIAKFVKQ
jgi:PKD repeat protein